MRYMGREGKVDHSASMRFCLRLFAILPRLWRPSLACYEPRGTLPA